MAEETRKIPTQSVASSSPSRAAAKAGDRNRWLHGLWVVLGGLAVILIGYIAAVLQGGEAATLFAGLTGVTGTIIGAYFGIQSGQGSKERAEDARERAEERTRILAAAHPRPEVAMRLLGYDSDALTGNTPPRP